MRRVWGLPGDECMRGCPQDPGKKCAGVACRWTGGRRGCPSFHSLAFLDPCPFFRFWSLGVALNFAPTAPCNGDQVAVTKRPLHPGSPRVLWLDAATQPWVWDKAWEGLVLCLVPHKEATSPWARDSNGSHAGAPQRVLLHEWRRSSSHQHVINVRVVDAQPVRWLGPEHSVLFNLNLNSHTWW